MKKLFALIAVFGMLSFGASVVAFAQEQDTTKAATDQAATHTVSKAQAQNSEMTTDPVEQAAAKAESGKSLHSMLKHHSSIVLSQ